MISPAWRAHHRAQLRPWDGYCTVILIKIPRDTNRTTTQNPLHRKVDWKCYQTPKIFTSAPMINCYQKRKFNMALRTWLSRTHVHPRSRIGERIKTQKLQSYLEVLPPITAIGSTLTYCSEGRTLSRVDRLHIAPTNSWCIRMKVEIKIRTIILRVFPFTNIEEHVKRTQTQISYRNFTIHYRSCICFGSLNKKASDGGGKFCKYK
jgi:hypothetical protein